ncbi:MAG: NYN domain-containing protein [Blastocatellia bacterium]
MSRIAFLVDGFNLYHALDHSTSTPNPKRYNKYKWLNLSKLARAYITSQDTITGVYYFTTLATWDPAKVAKHKLFIRANEAEGVQVVYGEFKRKQKRCNLCHKLFWTVEEKQTDVNMALKLFQLAVQDVYDKAIIISGDTDLLPAVKAVQATFPTKSIGVVLPIGRACGGLQEARRLSFQNERAPTPGQPVPRHDCSERRGHTRLPSNVEVVSLQVLPDHLS